MAYKFIKATKARNWNGVQVVIDGEPRWASCTKQVQDYAGKNFAEGDDVEFEYTVEDGKYNIEGYIKKVGGSSSSEKSRKETPQTSTGSRYDPAVQESIKRQAIGNMTSRTLIALTGQIDVNNVHEVAEEVYKTFQKLVG